MTAQMHYSTYGRRRGNRHNSRRALQNDRNLRRGAKSIEPASSQGRAMDSQEKKMKRDTSNPRRQSDPDGAYFVPRSYSSEMETEYHSKTRDGHFSRGRKMGSSHGEYSQPPSGQTRYKSGTNISRQRNQPDRSISPECQTSTSRRRSSSVRAAQRRSRSLGDERQRSASVRSYRSTKSSGPPELAKQISGFDLQSSNKIASNNVNKSTMARGAKQYLLNKFSGLSLIGGCKKNYVKPKQNDQRKRPTNYARNKSRRTRPRKRVYQMEDGSNTYFSDEEMSSSRCSHSAESESQFEDDVDEIVSDSSSNSSESSDQSYFMHKSGTTSSFVEDGFVSDDDIISGAEDLDPSHSKALNMPMYHRNQALVRTLEAENAALRASVTALRADWEVIVKRLKNLQGGYDTPPDEESKNSPNLEAIHQLRKQALESLDDQQMRRGGQSGKKDSDLKPYKDCVEELLCENERLYENIISLSQEREDILKELSSLREEAVTSFEESHQSGLLLTDEVIAKTHKKYIDDIASLLTRVKNDLSTERNRDTVDSLSEEIMKLVSKIITHRVEINDSKQDGHTHPYVESPRQKSSSPSPLHPLRDDSISHDKRDSFCSSSSSRRGISVHNSSSREDVNSDCTVDSESDNDDGFDDDFNIVSASMNSLFDGTSPSVSYSHDPDASSPDLGIVYEMFDSSDSECSSDCKTRSPRRSPKKTLYNAFRSVASRIRKTHKGHQKQIEEDEECATPSTIGDSTSRRSSGNSIVTDVEATTYYCSPSNSSPTSSRSGSSRHSRSSRRKRRKSNKSTSPLNFPPIEEELDIEEIVERDSADFYGHVNEYEGSTVSGESKDILHRSSGLDDWEAVISTHGGKLHGTAPKSSTSSPCYNSDNDNDTHATTCSESTKEHKCISITVVTRSSRHVSFPSSRSHTYMTFFTASLLKNQIDAVLQEQYNESMAEILGSTCSATIEVTSSAKTTKKKKRYQGEYNEQRERHGYGIYSSKNGNEYRGEWQHNKREGLGVVKIGNGDVFEGQFENNMKNGIGVYHYIDGECDLSHYRDDQRVGDSLRWTNDRTRAFLLSEEASAKEVSLVEALKMAQKMGVIVQL